MNGGSSAAVSVSGRQDLVPGLFKRLLDFSREEKVILSNEDTAMVACGSVHARAAGLSGARAPSYFPAQKALTERCGFRS
jgi:hypothetical protein